MAFLNRNKDIEEGIDSFEKALEEAVTNYDRELLLEACHELNEYDVSRHLVKLAFELEESFNGNDFNLKIKLFCRRANLELEIDALKNVNENLHRKKLVELLTGKGE